MVFLLCHVGETATPWPPQEPLAAVPHHKTDGQPAAHFRAAGPTLGQRDGRIYTKFPLNSIRLATSIFHLR